eukprot:403348040
MRLATSLVATLLFATSNAQYYRDSLAECNSFIKIFDTTAGPNDEPLVNGEKYQLVSCDIGTGGVCPDGTIQSSGKICSWARYLKVICYKNVGTTVISVTTNSMPNHCYNAYADGDQRPVGTAEFNDIVKYSWTVDFNKYPLSMQAASGFNTVSGYFYSKLTTQKLVDDLMCYDSALDSINLDPYMHYSEKIIYKTTTVEPWDDLESASDLTITKLPSSDNVAGIALNGVFIFSGTSSWNIDGFYPKSWNGQSSLKYLDNDVCMGTSESYNVYRYHMYSPCIWSTGSAALKRRVEACKDENAPNCQSDPTAFVKGYTDNTDYGIKPIGVAKDGRPIYNPYKIDGTLWQPCEVDICNGRFTSRNFYAYQLTMFYPYTIGCWGPGNSPTLKPSCSSNPRVCISTSNGSSSAVNLLINSLKIGVLSVFMMFASMI